MNKRWTLPDIILPVLFLSSTLAYAKEDGAKCDMDPDTTPRVVEIRNEPNGSAALLRSVKPDATEFRELDIVSKGPANNDWIKVASGDVTGWVKATGFQCRLSSEEAQQEIASQTARVIQAFRGKDMDALATYVHPVKGVRFSPSATVGTKSNVVLQAQEIRQWLKASTKRLWGASDGSGAPMRLTPAEYYAKFIYSRDFAKAPVIGFNTFKAQSTDRDNTWEVYPNALVVEYYFPPSGPDGNDWAGLRLVYEKHAGRWFLSGVIHNKWTI